MDVLKLIPKELKCVGLFPQITPLRINKVPGVMHTEGSSGKS